MKRLITVLVLLLARLAVAQPIPTIASYVASTGSTNVSNSAVTYFTLIGMAGTYPNLNNEADQINSPIVFVTNSGDISFTLSHLCCFLGAAPGTGKSYTINPALQSGTNLATTVTISDSATTACDTTHTASTASFGTSNIGYKVTPSGTPTATTVGCYIEATAN